MSNHIKALRDLLVILIVIGTISLVLSFITGRDNGEFDADERVASFLQTANPESGVVGTDDLDLSEISFNDIDGIDIGTAEAAVEGSEPSEQAPEPVESSDTTFREGTIEQDDTTSVTEPTNEAGSYAIEAGDTYGCIAEEYYGSYEFWPLVEAANAPRGVGFQELELHVGNTLELPAATEQKSTSSLCQ